MQSRKIKQKPLKMKAILALLLIAVIVAVATAQYIGYGGYYGGYPGVARFVPQEKNWNNKKLVNFTYLFIFLTTIELVMVMVDMLLHSLMAVMVVMVWAMDVLIMVKPLSPHLSEKHRNCRFYI